jgi:hypothetical protein
MRKILAIVLLLGGCASEPALDASKYPSRALTAAEKKSLTGILSKGLKEPRAAQFKWMPVILTEREGITDYCGLVNRIKDNGGYSGFVRFYAQLFKDSNGQFSNAVMRAVEEPDSDPDLFNTESGRVGTCEQFGYTNFYDAI